MGKIWGQRGRRSQVETLVDIKWDVCVSTCVHASLPLCFSAPYPLHSGPLRMGHGLWIPFLLFFLQIIFIC